MKVLSLFIILIISHVNFSQVDCTPYVPVSIGTKWEITNYSKKDKITGIIKYELLNKTETDSSSIFTLKATSFDDKGEETYVDEYTAECVNGIFKFDMAFKMDGQMMEAYKDMDVEMDASDFEIPTLDEEVGTILPDGTLDVKISSNGATMFNMRIEITDRVIEAKEEISTSAGNFDCILISQNVKTKMIIKIEASTKEWYSPNIGIVRYENYNKKGKLTGYSVLTSLTTN